jgi:hypothetical protein
MPKRLTTRLFALALVLCVFALGTQVVAHSDGANHDEAHCTCQICHIAHAAVPQPAAQAEIQVSLVVGRHSFDEELPAFSQTQNILSIPRAPPASLSFS